MYNQIIKAAPLHGQCSSCGTSTKPPRIVTRMWSTTTPTDSEDDGIRWKEMTIKAAAIIEIMNQPYF
jgi:hypothetical protein